jgi:opacity protein-like surface antigen
MKKLLLFTLLVSQFAFSQTEKGKFIISGSTSTELSFGKSKAEIGNSSNEQKFTNFDIKPSFGYFVADNFFIGLSGLYDFNHTKENRSLVVKTTSLVLMPQVGYYFMPESKFRPFLLGGIGFANAKTDVESNNFDPIFPGFNNFTNKLNGLAANLGGGVSYFITDNFSIDGQVSYNYLNLNQKNSDYTSKTSGVGFRVGFSFFL